MDFTETIPNVVTWDEIKAHCRLSNNAEEAYLVSKALGAIEQIELEAEIAIGQRTIVVTYSNDDWRGFTLRLPKGPAISVTSVVANGTTLGTSAYSKRRAGKYDYLHFDNGTQATPIVVTYVAGLSTVSQTVKDAILILVEHRRQFRGVTTSQTQNVVEAGYERILEAIRSNRSVVG